jgi:hypothetical protein
VLRETVGARHDSGDKFPSAKFLQNVTNSLEDFFLGDGILGADTSLTLEGGHGVIENVTLETEVLVDATWQSLRGADDAVALLKVFDV